MSNCYNDRMSSGFQGVMFDLDGTLADTLADIANIGNHTLTQLGRPTFPIDRYRYLAGQGARWLVETALGPEHQHLADEGLGILKSYQLEHGMDLTTPYDGVPELLDALIERALKLAVFSNKPHAATVEMIEAKFSRWHFDRVQGATSEYPLKPDPAAGLMIAEKLGIAPERWLYVGDTKVDMQTATSAGFHSVGVLWGFREEAELRENGARAIISHPTDLLALLD